MSVSAAAEKIKLWREKPQAFAREVLGITPDPWQDFVLEAFPHKQRMALKACKGPGKTATLAMLAWNFLLTRPHANIAATSITGDNLRDGLWKEMSKWQKRSPLLSECFEWQKERIVCREHPETWFMSARSWAKAASSEQQADALAGFHADYLLFLIDEAGGIPDAVMAAAEAALASGIECKLLIAGNPTHLEGPLYRASTTERALWFVHEITADPDDPLRTPRVSAQWAREQIQKYGRDNPWVLVNVFGRFPPSSLNTLIGPEEVRDAMKRHLREDAYQYSARILGVDVAREGDDRSIIFPRQGPQAFEPTILRNVNSLQGAGAVARKWNDWSAQAAFIDNTGGFGGGWIDQLQDLGFSPIAVHYAGSANDARYFNKRAEMWFGMCEWVKAGGALPPIDDLVAELSTPTYFFKGDKLQIEPKEQVKARLGRSPDLADALAQTFAQPVAAPPRFGDFALGQKRTAMAVHDYNPFE